MSELTTNIEELKKAGYVTVVVGPEKLTKENLSVFVTQVGVASKLVDKLDEESQEEPEEESATSQPDSIEEPENKTEEEPPVVDEDTEETESEA